VPWRAPIWAITLVLFAAADSVLAAGSRPFTLSADLETGFGLAGVVIIGLTTLRLRPTPKDTFADVAGTPPGRRSLVAWGTLASALVIFELVNYFAGPRSTHPTVSSLLDVLAGHEVLRGLLFATWLGAGWWLWRGP
jgi:hypothetical protein